MYVVVHKQGKGNEIVVPEQQLESMEEEGEGAGFVEDAADVEERNAQLRKKEALLYVNCM